MSTGVKIILIIVVLLAAFLGINYLRSSNTDAPTSGGLVSETFDTKTSSENQEFLRALKNLESVQLDGSILSSAAFNSLVDFSVSLVDQPKGRANPFRPINPLEAEFSAFTAGATSSPR